jgi:hypothetical protein
MLASIVGGDSVWTHVIDPMEVHVSAAAVTAVLKAEMPNNAKENPAVFVVGKIMVMMLLFQLCCCSEMMM